MSTSTEIRHRPSVSLDDKLALIKELDGVESMIKELEQMRDKLRDELKESIPVGHVGTINGFPAWGFTPQSGKIATARLRKDDPDLYAEFEEWETRKVIDVARLQRERPDVFERYQVCSLARVGPQG